MQNFADNGSAGAGPTRGSRAPDQSESEFLAAQAAAAREGLTDTLRRMGADLKDSADVAAWARRYPWPTLGVAAAAGFLAATALGTKRSDGKSSAEVLADALAAHGIKPQPKPSIWSGLLNEVARNLTGVLEGVIASALSGKMQQAAEPTTNGHEPHADSEPPDGHDMPPDGF